MFDRGFLTNLDAAALDGAMIGMVMWLVLRSFCYVLREVVMSRRDRIMRNRHADWRYTDAFRIAVLVLPPKR
jgi:hypothetical protein